MEEQDLRRRTSRVPEGGKGAERGVSHDPFNHPRDRRGYFRDTKKKLNKLEPGARINIFSFISRKDMPGVESGYVERVSAMTYFVRIMRANGRMAQIRHDGPFNQDDLHQLLLNYGYGNPDAETTLTVESKSAIDAIVDEYSKGFSTTSGLPYVGTSIGEHWVMSYWTPDTFMNAPNLTADQVKFLADNVAVIAHKTQMGAEPELEYYKTVQEARDKMAIYDR